jgi:hypothetical protein
VASIKSTICPPADYPIRNDEKDEFDRFPLKARIVLFAISFAPAVLILALRSIPYQDHLFAELLGGLFAALVFLVWRFDRFLTPRRGASMLPKRIVCSCEPADDGYVSYALGFLLPAALIPPNPWDVAGLMAFVVFFALIWNRTNMNYQNPVLALLGWHAWAATVKIDHDDEGVTLRRVHLVLHRSTLTPDEEIDLMTADGDVLFGPAR